MPKLPHFVLKRGALTAIAAIGLAACAGGIASGVTVSREDVHTSYLPEELYVVATGRNELRTIIVGQPFDMPKDAFDRAVLASMEGQNFGPRLNLSTQPEREDSRKRQVVIAFNLNDIQQVDRLCEGTGDTVPATDAGGKVTVTGVYCSGGGGYLTQATAVSGNVESADSAQFQRLMSQLALALFPDENPHRRDDGPDCTVCP